MYSTQAFRDVNRTIEVSEDDPDKFDITIELKEQRTASVSIGGGVDSATGAFGSLGISDNNFRGRNQRVSIMGLVGSGILMSDASISNFILPIKRVKTVYYELVKKQVYIPFDKVKENIIEQNKKILYNDLSKNVEKEMKVFNTITKEENVFFVTTYLKADIWF